MKDRICRKCKQREVEDFGDGEPSYQCSRCNDKDIQHSNERAEWNHFHND